MTNFGVSVAAAVVTMSLAAISPRAGAATYTLNPLVDGVANDTNGDGLFDGVTTNGTFLSVRNFPGTLIDRPLIEYSTTTIPAGIINSVTFQFYEQAFTSSSTSVNLIGYIGDGALSLSDATVTGTLLGNYNPVSAGIGAEGVPLDLAQFNALRTSPRIGLRLESGGGPVNTQITSSEGALGDWPLIVLNYTVPEPSSAAAVAVSGALFLRRCGRRITRQCSGPATERV
jgi:hypothetical protein